MLQTAQKSSNYVYERLDKEKAVSVFQPVSVSLDLTII